MRSRSPRARTWHYAAAGALGALVGFVLLEILSRFWLAVGSERSEQLVSMALYFAGFGLAVGGALGLTEGLVTGDRFRLGYGLIIGLLLGGVGGLAGGTVGQAIYGLVPLRYAVESNADLVIALDSSGSMRQLLFFGNDPRGRRKKAAQRLIDRLSTSDRVAVVDFDDGAQVLFPLTHLASPAERRRAKEAVDAVDSSGGTSLDAGLAASLQALDGTWGDGRPKHVIFLTDGQGEYTPGTFTARAGREITLHAVGLGDGVDAALLTDLAESTGGRYYPVADASDLIAVFESIFSEHVAMARSREGGDAELLTPFWVVILLRVVSWGAMGLAIGAGQGIRENTREDFRACALGGLLGGLLGGAVFDPVSELSDLGAGLVGRGLAEVLVGAMIGGSMRLAQKALVEATGKPTTTLLSLLPEKREPTPPAPAPRSPKPREPGRSPRPASPARPAAAPDAAARPARAASSPPAAPAGGARSAATPERSPRPLPEVPPREPPEPPVTPGPRHRTPLDAYQKRYPDPSLAMARAYRSGEYTLREIGEHFGVPASAVKRAVDQHQGR